MRSVKRGVLLSAMCTAAFAGGASADTVVKTGDIAVSETWVAANCYRLVGQVYVLPGATLTIEPGTIIASDPADQGSLAIGKGAQIIAAGTKNSPIIFTSTADQATWVGGDPKTGVWRESCNEWGNITILGAGYISENSPGAGVPPNVSTCDAGNTAIMEGLVAAFDGDPRVRYGGGNDADDSGTLSYVSLRYGGKVIGLANELNGLSLGGVGSGTDIHHVEIMNNVDDGIEIWGGKVNIKHASIWNVGDDSFDVDQGWRGKAQFLLIVQGYSCDGVQGSGVGDNAFEMDGAERSDWQPVTTAVIYNATVVGQPITGDHGMAFRDNARVQFHKSVFMYLGDRVVSNDGDGGEGLGGYGANGTLSFNDTWDTAYTETSLVNACMDPAAIYCAQTSGNLIEVVDSVFYCNTSAAAYTEANLQDVFNAANDNVLLGCDPADLPVKSVTFLDPPVTRGGLTVTRVTELDPRPNGAALRCVRPVPNDGFFSPTLSRGAFGILPSENWIAGWTASDAYGFTSQAAKTFCFDLKRGAATVATIVISKKAGGGFTASLVDTDDNILCYCVDVVPAGGGMANFDCGGVTVRLTKSGSSLTWRAGPFSGTLSRCR